MRFVGIHLRGFPSGAAASQLLTSSKRIASGISAKAYLEKREYPLRYKISIKSIESANKLLILRLI